METKQAVRKRDSMSGCRNPVCRRKGSSRFALPCKRTPLPRRPGLRRAGGVFENYTEDEPWN
jgi:hypothetical protein